MAFSIIPLGTPIEKARAKNKVQNDKSKTILIFSKIEVVVVFIEFISHAMEE